MRLSISATRTSLRRCLADQSGLALIEFAFALPFLLTISMVGIETARMAIITLRLNQVAMLAADNGARIRTSIDEKDVIELMTGLKFAGTNFKLGDNGRVIISGLESNGQTGANAGYKISWQRCYGAKNATSSFGVQGDGASNATLAAGMGPTGRKVKPVANTGLVFAEVRYDYKPIVAPTFMAGFEMTATQSFTVRDRANETITNTSSLSDSQKKLCDAAHLSAA